MDVVRSRGQWTRFSGSMTATPSSIQGSASLLDSASQVSLFYSVHTLQRVVDLSHLAREGGRSPPVCWGTNSPRLSLG